MSDFDRRGDFRSSFRLAFRISLIIVLLLITVLPVGLGMLIRAKKPDFAARSQQVVKLASVVALIGITGAIMSQEWAQLPGWFAEVGLICVTLGVVTILRFSVYLRAGIPITLLTLLVGILWLTLVF